jgi:spore coat protein U-like protein
VKTKINQRLLKLAIVSIVALGISGFSVHTFASPATSDMAVTANIAMSCSISTTDISFGAYDAVGAHAAAPLMATGGVSSTCTTGASGNIKISQGLNAAADSNDSTPLRRMVASTDPASFLDYEVFSDSGRSVVWENGTGVPYTGTGSAVPLTVYGSVAAAQTSAVSGSYSDTVTVAINY